MNSSGAAEPVPAGAGRPSGIVTFVFTDIEGSTLRWERAGEAMRAALRRHDELMYAVFSGHDGFVFKTIGDAFCVAFARAGDALEAALAAQHRLAEEDFSAVDGVRVRMALHAGSADERDGDYFGPVVNRVARLLAIGHGGQVLLSNAARNLVQGLLPPESGLLELGTHRLKDLAEPEIVYQLVAPGLSEAFPPLRSLDVLANNLPNRLTTFVGRDAEVTEIAALLGEQRLVTLAGSGGVGKTRAALQVAADVVERYHDGVWFVELAAIAQSAYLPSTIAQAAQLTLASGLDPQQTLLQALAAKDALLVLDNCEHVLEGIAGLSAAILRVCPKVRILATSRQPLNVTGEIVYRMPSLSAEASIALFADRAKAVDQHFSLTGGNEAIVAEICRHLDGIPLAIELAAARVTILSPRQIRERLDERFRVLTGGNRDALPRQQTLRALIDWSHDLLDERERALFRRLSVFVDGFPLEGATIADAEASDGPDVVEVLASLVDKSLVLSERSGEEQRYRMLESTRAYAREKLAAAGEVEMLEERRLRFLREHFAAARTRFDATMRNDELIDALGSELEDVRAALDSAAGSARVLEAARMLTQIGEAWVASGLGPEGLRRLHAFIELIPESEAGLLRHLWMLVARLHSFHADVNEEFEAASRALAYARREGHVTPALCSTLATYAAAASSTGRFSEAEGALDEAQALPGLAEVHRLGLEIDRAVLANRRGDVDVAAREYERLWRSHTALGDTYNWGMALNLADAEFQRDVPHAIAVLEEVLPSMRAKQSPLYLGPALALLAACYRISGDDAGARAASREALDALGPREPGSGATVMAIEELALTLLIEGNLSDGAALAAYAEAALPSPRAFEFARRDATQRRLRAMLDERFGSDERQRLKARGESLSPDAAVALALEASAAAPAT